MIQQMTPQAKAYSFAAEKHKGQMYGGHQYIYHLNQVATYVAMYAVHDVEVSVMVALLHDILEDTDATEDEVAELFGTEVYWPVYVLTKLKGESYEDYIAAVKSNPTALFVKKWDTFCNLQESLKQGDVRRVNKYAKQLALLTEEKSC